MEGGEGGVIGYRPGGSLKKRTGSRMPQVRSPPLGADLRLRSHAHDNPIQPSGMAYLAQPTPPRLAG